MKVLIVESPAKAKTINKYLGKDFVVLASFGHVRDLPSKNGSVDTAKDFSMVWETDARSEKHISAITKALKGAEGLYLATDPDREGEAISWHLLELVKERAGLKKIPVYRVTFNEITASAVKHAMDHPRQIDAHLVDAYLTRRALDYLVGFTLSPVLWRKLPGSRSAGRVQSVALRLICERENEIEAFKTEEYWTVKGDFTVPEGTPFEAKLTHLKGEKLDKFTLNSEGLATEAVRLAEAQTYAVSEIERKMVKRHPYAPFITSTLQQEASRKLYMNASQSMRVAQRLYEGVEINGELMGLITYMRTDGVQLSQDAISQARAFIGKEYGDAYLPSAPRVYKNKSKNAQEAHEAIRPTNLSLTPEKVHKFLDNDQYKLYELIWKRTIACQMESAVFDKVAVDLLSADKKITFRANGSVVKFDGFLKVYKEGFDDKNDDDDDDRLLPNMQEGMGTDLKKATADQHFTQPPPRYSDASLVKKLEELGIGRPSTYASIIQVLQDRNYVRVDKRRFYPEERGRIVTVFLVTYFPKYVEYSFTASLEDQLDDVAEGKVQRLDLLKSFWAEFHQTVEGTKDLKVADVLDVIDAELSDHLFPATEDGSDPRKCPKCSEGKLHVKLGKFGAFIGCTRYPDCDYTRQITHDSEESAGASVEEAKDFETRVLGKDPTTGLDLAVKKGPYGFYVQLGEAVGKEKPKRASLAKGQDPQTLTLDQAVEMMRLPKSLGTHPTTGEDVSVGVGRFGPYVKVGSKFTSVKGEDILTLSLARAVEIASETLSAGKEIGKHPKDNAPIYLAKGRYGQYLKHNKTNAPIPKSMDPETLTLDQAVELITKREATPPVKKGRRK